MAKVYIGEVEFMGAGGYDQAPIARLPFLVDQVIDFTSGATPSAAFSSATTYIRIWSDTQCCITYGATPVATTTKTPMSAFAPEYFGVAPGSKISVIAL